MGGGGVACMPLQQHATNIMERFPDTTTTSHCASGGPTTGAAAAAAADSSKEESRINGSTNGGGCVATTSNGTGLKTKRVVKRIVKVKKVVTVKKPMVGAAGSNKASKVVANGTNLVASKTLGNKDEMTLVTSQGEGNKEEVEEGELGTLKSPPRVEVDKESAGSQENPKRNEVHREDGDADKSGREEVERGEAVPRKLLRKGDSSREACEEGDIIPDRWQSKGPKYGFSKSRSRHEMIRDQTPPGKYSSEVSFRRKDISRNGNIQLSKGTTRWEAEHDRSTGRSRSRSVDENGSYHGDYNNGWSHGKERPLGNRLKRLVSDSGGTATDCKLFGDYEDYMGPKSRRIGENGHRTANSEYYTPLAEDKFYKGSGSSSSRIFALDKYSTRHHEPTLSSKVVYDRHGRSPAQYERSPLDKGQFYDPRDRSPLPLWRDRSPFSRDRSPYGRDRTLVTRERSPYGGDKTPFGRERSPYGGERTPYGRERSPYGRERSPYGGERIPHVREKSPCGHERSPFSRAKSALPRVKSPHDGGRNYKHRCRGPVNSEQTPQDRGRHRSRRDRVPNVLDRSPHDCSRPVGHREPSRKGGVGEKRSSQNISKWKEDKVINKILSAPDIPVQDKVAEEKPDTQFLSGTEEKDDAICESHIDEHSLIPKVDEFTHADGPPHEEFLSMEEDMDICDTPPHVSAVPHVPLMLDSSMGKWYYLDYFGMEQGPSRLFDLKALVDDGILLADHFVKHMDTDRWVTIEKAVSPVVPLNIPSIFPEAVTQLVTPPEAPGNVLTDTGQVSVQKMEDAPTTSLQTQACACNSTAVSEPLKDLKVDERVGALLEGFTVVPGRELETIGKVLQMTFEHVPSEEWAMSEGHTSFQTCSSAHYGNECDTKGKEEPEEHQIAPLDSDQGLSCSLDVADCFSGPWYCKGGDWKRQDDAVNDRILKRKLVLNDGFSLCQMPKAGYEDPRWHGKDDLYYPSQSKRLDLPLWSFSWLDEKGDVGKLAPTKPPVARGVKGTTLPVIRINACVVKDHGSFISESLLKVRGKDRYTSRSTRMSSAANDGNRSTVEGDSLCKMGDEQESNSSCKSNASITIPKDRLCSVHDLQLHLGDWYYLDGAGHVQGPQLYSELQALVDQGLIQNHSSVFRKSDRLWVPITSAPERSEPELKYHMDSATPLIDSSSFHSVHPQFVGYMRGKLHELVMKAYKNREFAAVINEVLDPWVSSKLPMKDSVRGMYYWKSDFDGRAGKRPWLQDNDSAENCELNDNLYTVQKDETPFEELCGDSSFTRDETAYSGTENGSWGLLDGHMLARVFHFLRLDMKSLAFASLTCKHWRAAIAFYKGILQHVDFSSFGPGCNDFMMWNVLNGYNRQRIKSMVLVGCTSITSSMLEQIVRSFPYLSSVDIRGCGQFGELVHQFPNVSWIKSCYSRGATISKESHFSKNNLKRKTEDSSDTNDFNLTAYIESGNNRDSANQLFRRSFYKRSKLFDARKSSSIVSRDARTSRWSLKKSEIWPKKMEEYKRMEEFLTLGLRDVMKLNTFDFFVSKVSEMEERMKSGCYIKHGFRSVKNDIVRMCKEARKARIRGSGDISHTIDLFFKLVSHLGKSSKLSYGKDQLLKGWKDDLTTGSTSTRNKKSTGRHMTRNNGSISASGSFDHGKGASKWNKKSMDSTTDSSDDFGSSSLRVDSESTASDTESDSDFRPGSQTGESRGDGCSITDESCVTNEREWGARMTKASLVPPVTRKYEVIDRYVIVADEEDVQRKMSVSLPDDYAEKLDAQKNGAEELDMELPEVKDYKPRKQLGEEVIEQEVYGIDPYTHNLLLDSMPEELGWTLSEKHLFIEDVLLRTLNQQVRCFTGTGNTPMMFPLQPVIEEIEKATARDSDTRTVKMCRYMLKAMSSRRDDNYVAYRKGLGVVCNKDGGFGEEDFVVEFLGEVYPAWKWFEKQDGIRSLQKDSQDPTPEFYNIYLERPKGDADGYDLVVVDAMHKANYASRICHSCRPNCEAKVTAVGGQYQIGIYAVREIQCGEEITFDYNSVTESKEEYEASVCLCGSQVCRGSYLNLTGDGAFQKVFKKFHGILDRHRLMIEACQLNSVSEDDYLELGRAGLGSCLLGGLPGWVVAYSARLVMFINRERTKLPKEILRHNLEEKKKYFSDICMEVERSDAEVQAEGVYNQRLQNLAVTLDKVRYVMRCSFGDPKKAPPPLEKLSPEETVSFLWKGEGSLVEELLQCMSPLVEPEVLSSLKAKIRAHDPSDFDDMRGALQKSLLWLRDELRSLQCTDRCQHDAAADLIHVYAYTKFFFRVRKYMTFTSPPVYISPLDLGPETAEKLGPSNHDYRKTYGENYCMGQLIFWHIQTNVEPDYSLDNAVKGCLSLPSIASFYTKTEKLRPDRSNGSRLLRVMLERMEKRPQKPWPRDQYWSFKNFPDVIGSPMLDAILLDNSSLDREMISWLKQRPSVFQHT